MSHLGTQISALADGQLSPSATERALAHVATCRACAEELQAAREARRTLAGAGDVLPAPDLTARLLALGALPAGDRPHDPWAGTSVPLPGTATSAHGSLRGDVVGRSTPRPLLVALAGGAGAVAVGLALVGGQPAVVPETDRSFALAVLADAAGSPAADAADAAGPSVAALAGSSAAAALRGEVAAGTAPATDAREPAADEPVGLAPVTAVDLEGPAAHAEVVSWMQDHGWVSPVALPDAFRVTGLRVDEETRRLELDLAHATGTVVVLQEPGRLDDGAVDGLPVRQVRGREVHLVSADPWYVVWQDGDTVVTVVAEGWSEATHDLVGAHPGDTYDDGLGARLARGWHSVAGSWSP